MIDTTRILPKGPIVLIESDLNQIREKAKERRTKFKRNETYVLALAIVSVVVYGTVNDF